MLNRQCLRGVGLVACAVVLAVGRTAVAQELTPSDEKLREMVDRIAERTLEQRAAVGLSIAVARGDELILARGYGLAELEHDVPADADTLFRIGPLTRGITAAAVLRLAEQGQINLEQSINDFLPDFPLQDHHVTVRHLLTQTSGMMSYTFLDEWYETKALDMTAEEVLAMFQDEPFPFDPGAQFNHNNSDYFLLGLIIERVTGRTYEEYVRDEFFMPLGMGRARFDSNEALIPNRAQGYKFENGGLLNDDQFSITQIRSAGAVLASARDLITWQMALFNGEMLNEQSMERMTTPYVLNNGRLSSHGMALAVATRGDRQAFEQFGNIFGFDGASAYYPDEKLHVVVLANCQNISAARVVGYIALAAFGETVPLLAAEPVEGKDFSRFAGRYRLDAPAAELEFQVGPQGNLFIVSQNQSTIRLLYMGGNTFMYDTERVNITFNMDPLNPAGKAISVTVQQGDQSVTAERYQ